MSRPSSCDLYTVVIDDPQAQQLILQVSKRICRMMWGSATAYRLGMISRYTRLDNPYSPGTPRFELFSNGAMEVAVLRMEKIA